MGPSATCADSSRRRSVPLMDDRQRVIRLITTRWRARCAWRWHFALRVSKGTGPSSQIHADGVVGFFSETRVKPGRCLGLVFRRPSHCTQVRRGPTTPRTVAPLSPTQHIRKSRCRCVDVSEGRRLLRRCTWQEENRLLVVKRYRVCRRQ